MNLEIEGRTAVVRLKSRARARRCAQALAQEGVHVILNGRDNAKLEKAAACLREIAHGNVTPVVADIATREGRKRLVSSAPAADILINNNGGPKPANFVDLDHDAWMTAIEANMIAPLMLTRALLPGMQRAPFRTHYQHHVRDGDHAASAHDLVSRHACRANCRDEGIALDAVRFNARHYQQLLPERFDTDRQHQMARGRDGAREHLL
ncbi:SDR family NAD(P)-dependent oxidoreductase [Bradyrhizobium sp. RDT10]